MTTVPQQYLARLTAAKDRKTDAYRAVDAILRLADPTAPLTTAIRAAADDFDRAPAGSPATITAAADVLAALAVYTATRGRVLPRSADFDRAATAVMKHLDAATVAVSVADAYTAPAPVAHAYHYHAPAGSHARATATALADAYRDSDAATVAAHALAGLTQRVNGPITFPRPPVTRAVLLECAGPTPTAPTVSQPCPEPARPGLPAQPTRQTVTDEAARYRASLARLMAVCTPDPTTPGKDHTP